jgi:hypothetical protein
MMLVAYREAETPKVHQRHDTPKSRRDTIAAAIPSPVRSAMDMEEALVHAICRRTGGRVHALQVHILGGRVVLRGWAGSYHAVQLAIAALFETFRAMNLDRPEDVELDIDVICRKASS